MRVFCCSGLYAVPVAITPELAAVKAYLGEDSASQWDDDELTRTYAAELEDQTKRCRIPYSLVDGVVVFSRPAALDEALLRRVARNLALRKAPLGIAASTDGVDVVRVGSSDPEIRRLEGPYRRMVI